MTDTQHLWEQQPYDTAKSYQAFCDYRDMGVGRSLAKLVERYVGYETSRSKVKPPTKTLSTIEGWSSSHKWQERVQAWDKYQLELAEHAATEQRQLAAKEFETQRLEARKNRQQIIRGLQAFLTVAMNQVQEQMKQDKPINPVELNTLATAAQKIIQESRSEFNDLPTQNSKVSGDSDSPLTIKIVRKDS